MPEFKKPPGYDWNITYRFDGEHEETMSVFGQIDALKEARCSLYGIDNMNAGTYEITAVKRA